MFHYTATAQACAAWLALTCTSPLLAGDDPFADVVVDYTPGVNPVPGYTDSSVALGRPERFTGELFDPMIVSIFNPPWRPDEIVSIGAGGSITLQFNTPVTDDPDNPFGIDLIVFGNALFNDPVPLDGVVSNPAQLLSEPGVIEVSPDGQNWTEVPGVFADAMFPTEGYLDHDQPYATTAGNVETNFTLPVNPALSLSDFDGASYADIKAMYRGSGGGAGIDIGPIGLSSISYVRISNAPDSLHTPEVDAVADVAARKPGDVNSDGIVNLIDLLAMLDDWGAAHPAGWRSEFTGDAVVDLFDLLLLLDHWGS